MSSVICTRLSDPELGYKKRYLYSTILQLKSNHVNKTRFGIQKSHIHSYYRGVRGEGRGKGFIQLLVTYTVF